MSDNEEKKTMQILNFEIAFPNVHIASFEGKNGGFKDLSRDKKWKYCSLRPIQWGLTEGVYADYLFSTEFKEDMDWHIEKEKQRHFVKTQRLKSARISRKRIKDEPYIKRSPKSKKVVKSVAKEEKEVEYKLPL